MAHFCLNCGTALGGRLIEGSELEACPRCDFVLWHDPKVVTMVVVETADGILLGRRAIEPGLGLWCLPGGFVNYEEHPSQAAVRECREEIGADVQILGLLGVYHVHKRGGGMVGLGYRAQLLPGQHPHAGEEMLELRAFAPGDLPELAFSSHLEAMTDWLALREESVTRMKR
jgi:ADP-ribose pyrophosphatase YjhB (NUDIX family)